MNLRNSDHLHSLIRAGRLYLTVQDAIALAIENNLDLEVDRYGPLSAEWALQRARRGGPLRGVTNGSTLVNQATSGQGVVGSQVAAGLSSNNSGTAGGNGGAIVSQIGPVTQNLDPVLQNATVSRTSPRPQPITIQSQTAALVDTHHVVDYLHAAGIAERRLRAGERQRILPERKCAHRLAESIGGAGGADLHSPQFAARVRDRRERPVYPGGSEECTGAHRKRFDRNC